MKQSTGVQRRTKGSRTGNCIRKGHRRTKSNAESCPLTLASIDVCPRNRHSARLHSHLPPPPPLAWESTHCCLLCPTYGCCRVTFTWSVPLPQQPHEAAEQLCEDILSKADVIEVSGDPICSFDEVTSLLPRSRFEIKVGLRTGNRTRLTACGLTGQWAS